MKFAVLFKVTLGFLALLFAAVGVLVPVLPTTPFVLVAIGCFSATPKLRGWLLQITWFREYYESYTAGTGVRRQTVRVSLLFLWGMLAVSIVLVGKLWVTLLLLLVGAAVTAHILWIAQVRAVGKRPARLPE